MNNKILTLVTSFSFILPVASHAAEPQYALSLYGDIKYAPDFTHFDYTNPDAPKGGVLKLSSIGSFDNLNPYIIKGSTADAIDALTNPTLMAQSYDEPFTMYGYVAETVELADDRSTISFNLHPEARWDDGTKLTANDVVWTFNTLIKDGAPFYRAYYADVTNVTADNAERVTFSFAQKNNRELPLIIAQMPILPAHYWKDKSFDKTTLEPPVAAGPYKITSVTAGRQIEFTRNADWWAKDLSINKGRYNFDKISYNYYRDQNVALEAFFAGEFDLQQENVAKLWQTAYTAPPVLDGRIIKTEIANKRPAGLQGFIYNTRRPVFSDSAVRNALAYAFDFEWENKQFAFGSYTRTRSYFENSELAATGLPTDEELAILEPFRNQIPAEVFREEYNPPKTDGSGNNRLNLKKATEILDAAGYKIAKDGIRVHEKTGTRLEFEFIDANPAFERWILPFVQNLKKIGVKANFRVVDEAQYINRMQTFDFDMTTSVIPQSNSPGNEQREFWLSEKATVSGSRNYIGVQNPVIDQLVEQIISANTREDLVAHSRALDRVLQWNYYTIPNWYYNKWRIAWWAKLDHPKTLSGLTPAITDTWWVKPE
ncbi:MAG TPA: extracellular solute-binding protein [Alphaproteobacteria bacterium]|jgi:microcin C transport system substrate-binding protein|nr:ABC transporter substrate-binding protein [Alphaproteobacteria bacterium]HRK97494.1 extracellular solute-binding protein [Alphaproteobacteria bacterium]